MNKIKKIVNNKYFIIGLITLFIITIGITGTYAWLTWSSPNTTEMTITIGNIADVIFDNGQDIYTTNLSPVFYPEAGEKSNFSIVKRSTAASANITYTVNLDITSIAEELKSASFKYKLINNTSSTEVVSGDFSGTSNGSTLTLYTGILTDTRADYTFLIYIDSNIENNTNMMGKEFSATLNITASNSQTLTETITYLYTNASKSTVTNNSITYNIAPSVGLMNDRLGGTTESLDGGNIRYYGASPNNYIYFNCSDYSNQTSDTCELWRIIGVFDGKVKIIRNESIGEYSWDNKDTTTGAETNYGKNDWTTARLMKLLNPSDYYAIDSNDNGLSQSLYYTAQSGTCYSGENNAATTCDFTSTGIKNDTTRNMISEVSWNLGRWDDFEVYSDQIYGYERETNVYTGRQTSWTGKIALMYPSDYGYATDFTKCSQNLYNYNSSTDSYACRTNDWLYNSVNQWLLTPDSSNSNSAWRVGSAGSVTLGGSVCYAYGVRPVLYLASELSLSGGVGSSADPYRLSSS